MNREQVIAWARECGLSEDAGTLGQPPGPSAFWTAGDRGISIPDLERFASLVAAHEREECAKLCEGQGDRAGAYSGQEAEIAAGMECAAVIRARKP